MTNNYNPGRLTDKEHLTRYHDIFTNTFLPNSDEIQVIFQWLQNDFEHEILPRLVSASGKGSQLKALGVGTGDGDKDQVIIRKLIKHFGRLSYTIVEPGGIIEKFRLNVSTDPELRAAQYTWHNVPFENFCLKTSGSSDKYEFISVIHSVYYLKDTTSSLKCLLEILQDGGVLMFIINDGTYLYFISINSL
ncbi:histamine N-methyltransferase-like [Diadema antillarum]|uniref:histamine N-methyltransferase-like n=1 Tax=Diadema antillarum TaxID=105358 RepID=UPI003A8A2956